MTKRNTWFEWKRTHGSSGVLISFDMSRAEYVSVERESDRDVLVYVRLQSGQTVSWSGDAAKAFLEAWCAYREGA